MKPTLHKQNPSRPLDLRATDNFLDPILFDAYIACIGLSILTNICSIAILLKKPRIFHFSFLIFLIEILASGNMKLLIRIVMTINFDIGFSLFNLEMLFDFTVMAITFMMSLNRFTLILFPTRSVLYDKGSLQCFLSAFVWTISGLGCISFFIGKCKRQILLDGTFVDLCTMTLEGNAAPVASLATGYYREEYLKNPILYDVAQLVRNIIIRCYDILPLISFFIYAITTILLLMKKKTASFAKRRTNFNVLMHGFLILIVYGIASIINWLLNEYYSDIREKRGAAMQFLLFLYIAVDVLTVALIPVSIILAVPKLRAAPKEFIEGWRKKSRNRLLAQNMLAK